MSPERPGALWRHFALMGVAVGLWWLLPGAVRRVAREGFYEFQAPFFLAESRLKDLRQYWLKTSHTNDDLIAAGRDLARVNADLYLRLSRADGLARENRRLADALGLPSRREFRQVVARVADRDVGRWWSRVVLARGARDGVKAGCGVVNGGGIVGVVTEVHRDTCEVRLLTDPDFRIAANIDGDPSDRVGVVIYTGATTTAFGEPRGRVTNIVADFKNETGGPLRLVSSELGGKFLFGLNIGILETDPKPTSDGLFAEADIRVRPDLFDLQEATILVPVPEPDTFRESP